MPWSPTYSVYIEENADLEPVGEGQEYPDVAKDATWDGEAESPEEAIENGRAVWRAEYGDDPPSDVLVRCTPSPDVCTACEGRGWALTYISPHDPPAKKSCRQCLGTGNQTQKGPIRFTER
jgi:hypothetical protein